MCSSSAPVARSTPPFPVGRRWRLDPPPCQAALPCRLAQRPHGGVVSKRHCAPCPRFRADAPAQRRRARVIATSSLPPAHACPARQGKTAAARTPPFPPDERAPGQHAPGGAPGRRRGAAAHAWPRSPAHAPMRSRWHNHRISAPAAPPGSAPRAWPGRQGRGETGSGRVQVPARGPGALGRHRCRRRQQVLRGPNQGRVWSKAGSVGGGPLGGYPPLPPPGCYVVGVHVLLKES